MLDESKKKEFIKNLGEVVGRFKTEKQLSYRKIAAQCDLDASYISKIEKGTKNITLETVLNLAYGLNVSPKDLFDFEYILNQDDIRK